MFNKCIFVLKPCYTARWRFAYSQASRQARPDVISYYRLSVGVLGNVRRIVTSMPRLPAPGLSLQDCLPDVSLLWHPTRNAPLTPRDVSTGSVVRVWWSLQRESCAHEWQARVADVTAGSRCPCPDCQTIKRQESRKRKREENTGASVPKEPKFVPATPGNSLLERFPDVARKWHGSRNPADITPANVPAKSHLKYWWCFAAPDGTSHEWQSCVAQAVVAKRHCRCPECVTAARSAATTASTEQRQRTNLERYGVPVASQAESARQKLSAVGKLKGAEAAKKRLQTARAKRGVDHVFQDPSVREKIKRAHLTRRGVDHISKDPNITQAKRENYFARTGFYHPSQNPDVASKRSKSAFGRKEFTFPDGVVALVQGYEMFFLRHCVASGLSSADVLWTGHEGMPYVRYQAEDREHVYHPDFYLPREHKVVEIKSLYTLERERHFEQKRLAVLGAGFTFELIVYDKDGDIVEQTEWLP